MQTEMNENTVYTIVMIDSLSNNLLKSLSKNENSKGFVGANFPTLSPWLPTLRDVCSIYFHKNEGGAVLVIISISNE